MSIHRSIISNLVTLAIILMAIVPVVRIEAATISSANDVLTTLQTSQAANHTVLFTNASTVSEGSTMTVTFASSFTTSSITEDDVDVSDDGVDLTTASSCAGSEKASVAMASNVLTITICAGDGGAIAASSSIQIEIGTNATSSGTGSNRITNPSSAGTYFVTVGGTFDDAGSIALPIRSSSDAITVTGIIPSTSSGSSSGSASSTASDNTGNLTQTDSTAPVISSIVVSQITKNSATISWNTNEDANSKVLYGLTSSVEPGLSFDTALAKTHTASLSGLSEGTTYYFQIRSADASNNIASSAVSTFATLDQTAPIITNISVKDITKSSAKITWTTNEAATSVIEYGTTNAYGFAKSDATMIADHSVTLTSLTAGTTYNFRAKSQDASTNQAQSTDQTFATLADVPPTNVGALTIVEGDTTLSLSWVNPTDDDFAGVKILRCANGYPSGPSDASCTTVTDNSKTTTLSQNGLSNGTTYYYAVFAKDLAGQFASGALVLGKPSAPEKEVLPKESEKETPAEPAAQPSVGQPQVGSAPDGGSEGTPSQTGGGLAVSCGDKVCSESETSFSCPTDCVVPTPPPNGTGESQVRISDVVFSVASGTISLPIENGFIDVLPSSGLSVRIPASSLGSNIDRVTLTVGADTYLMRPVTAKDALSLQSGIAVKGAASGQDIVLFYVADIVSPSTVSLHPLTIFVEYADGSLITISSFLRVIAPGHTIEIIDGEEMVVAGVQLTLEHVDGSIATVWDGSPYSQMNPTISDSDGSIAWYAPNGQYRVRAEREGYETVNTGAFTVSNSIASPRVVMASLKKEVLVEPAKDAGVPQSFTEQISATVLSIAATPAIQAVQQGLETVRNIPGVEQAAEVSLPALTITAGASVIVMSVAFDFLPFLQYLFTSPILFLWRRKRKAFGVIYNAISKEPIGLAVVRLFALSGAEDRVGKLVRSRVTDKGGRFYFLVQPGIYRLTVTKVGFQFPTGLIADKKEDVQYIDLYHGEVVTVSEKDAVLTPNIPLDPSTADQYHEPKKIVWRARLQFLQHIVALGGTIASLIFAIIRPTVLAAVMVVIQLAIFFVAKNIARPRKPKSWGIVYDKKTGRPLSNVVARIFEPKYNKLLETQVTDARGRYSFLLGPNEYYAVFEREGYRSTQVRPIDYTQSKEAQDFSMDIRLHGAGESEEV